MPRQSGRARAGLLHGYPDSTFRPDEHITREELAAVIMRLVAKLGFAIAESSPQGMAAFSDADDISPWARELLSQAVDLHLLRGTPEGKLLPKGKTTRAQAGVIIRRTLEKAW